MLLSLLRLARPKVTTVALCALLVGACSRTPLPVPAAGPQKAAATGLSYQAELAPIAALAWSDPFLWIGSDRGLRRFRPATGELEWVAADAGLAGHRVTALATDGAASVFVGTEVGLGRVSDAAGKLDLTPLVTVGGLSLIAPSAPRAGGGGAWLGTDHGLFFFDGTSLSAVGGLGKGAINFLHADADGKSVWAGVRGRGLAHVDRARVVEVFGPEAPGAPDFVETLGMAALENGTPFAIGRGRDGAGRMALLHKMGGELLVVDSSIRLLGAAAPPTGPLVFASASGGPTSTYTLALAERGEAIAPGEFRFVPRKKGSDGPRVVATPDGRSLPSDVTAFAMGSSELFFGTRVAGVAQLGAASAGRAVAPAFLPIGELAWKASALGVACLERDRCVVATGAGPGWIWDGGTHAFRPIPPEALGSPLMALEGDGAGSVYFMAGEGPKGIKVARLSADGRSWEPVLTFPVDTEGAPFITYTTMSPQGNLWMAVRDRLPGGEQAGRGIIELQLPSGRAIHHRVTRAGQARPAESIPVPGDVRAVQFVSGAGAAPEATWFCTSLGVLRWSAGKMTRWSENDGLGSDTCADLKVGDDGAVWAATRAGVARFDGKSWVPLDGAPAKAGAARRWPLAHPAADDDDGDLAAARSLATVAGKLWAGTSRGVWPVTATGKPLDARSGLTDDDVVDMALDRFGRLWVLGHLGLTVADTFPLR